MSSSLVPDNNELDKTLSSPSPHPPPQTGLPTSDIDTLTIGVSPSADESSRSESSPPTNFHSDDDHMVSPSPNPQDNDQQALTPHLKDIGSSSSSSQLHSSPLPYSPANHSNNMNTPLPTLTEVRSENDTNGTNKNQAPLTNGDTTTATHSKQTTTTTITKGEKGTEIQMTEQKARDGAVSPSTSDLSIAVDGENENTPVQLLSLPGLAQRYKTNLHFDNPRQSSGLSDKDAIERLQRDGLNILTPPKEIPEIFKYFSHYLDPFMLLLILSGVLSCIAYGIDTTQPINLWIGVVLFVLVIISSSFSYIQAGKASAVMKAFKNMLPRGCHVIRDGRLQDIPAANLVVGDVVRIGTGDQVPADIRLIYVNDLKVEVSSLTGESLPISCTTTSKELRVEEAKNVTFNSSQCLEGEAVGVVYATGDRTLIGTIAKLASQTTTVDTTLQKEVKGFVKRLTVFSFIMGVIFFIIGIARGQPPVTAFINGFIVVMIANVPEGLPVTVVTILTITGRRLAALNVFVKQLSSVETLGSATVIASDKTGTLTQNKMSVSRLWFDLTPMSVETVYRDLGPPTLTMNPNKPSNSALYTSTATLRAIERVCAVCSRTRFADHRDLTDEEARVMESTEVMRQLDPTMTLRSAKAAYPQFLSMLDSNLTINSAKRQAFSAQRDDSKRSVIGDASEVALFNFIRARQSIELVRYHNRLVFEVPFNSRNKYALTIMKPYNIPGNTDHRRILLMKGAPEIVLSRCNRWMNRGKILPIDEEFNEHFQAAYETFGGYGERVLGFAQLELDEKEFPPEMDTKYSQKEENYPTKDLVFLGLISLIDPPKDSVPGAIAMCRSAGVRVVMVTGDHPLTAAAIARQVGIITTNTKEELAKMRNLPLQDIPEEDVDAIVVKGIELDKWSQADWDRVLSKAEIVFARTTPSQKLQIVENLQRLKNIVAVTGDGVNDSPALKKGDIGVAMGISGSDVARDAGDVILMDDDFGSIVVGIREGRTIFDNLTKTIAYTVTHMPPEVIPILLNLAFGFPLGLNAILILSIDCGTELAPAISLAYEKAESDVMNRPPRNAETDHLVTLRTVTYWYLLAGAWETLVCYLNYFLVFNYYGIDPHNLPFTDTYWNEEGGNSDFTVGNGRTYDNDDQVNILAQAQTAYWVTLTGCQVFHIWMCKTRVLSVFKHGIFDNINMNIAVILEIAIIIIIAFIPAHSFFGNGVFPGIFWLIILVGWAGLFLLNEPRKYLIRNVRGNRFVDFLTW